MDIQTLLTKKIGVWGYGIGGKALVAFLRAREVHVLVYDKRELTVSEKHELQKIGGLLCVQLEEFFVQSDIVIPSAGIDLGAYKNIFYKFLSELDFFALFFKKPIIAITGTLGKTTVTTMLSKMLERAGKQVLVGGNIGIGLCSLIDHQQEETDYAVLEVSSFQLERCRVFTPTVAVWTNFFANHLDRHASVQEYFEAKTQIVKRQSGDMISVVPANLLEKIKRNALYNHTWVSVSSEILPEFNVFIAHQPGIRANWHVVAQTLFAMGISTEALKKEFLCAIEHRIEFVRELNQVRFYNDSKSTVIEATRAALERFDAQKIILLLGGLSKGVDREPFVRDLAGCIKYVICFGKEAVMLSGWCDKYAICHKSAPDLAQAVKMGYTCSTAGDIVLLSPAGSSFDLFANYQERGAVFKRLVSEL